MVALVSRALVTTDTSTGSSRLRSAALRCRGTASTTVAARFLRYQRRDPALLAYWAIVVVIMFLCCASTIFGRQHHPAVVITAASSAQRSPAPMTPTSPGSRAGVRLEALALSGRRELRPYFSGQDIVYGAIAVPLITGISFGLAALVKDPREDASPPRSAWPDLAPGWR